MMLDLPLLLPLGKQKGDVVGKPGRIFAGAQPKWLGKV